MNTKHTVCIDKIEGEYDLHHKYSMIQVQLLLYSLYNGSDDEAETINDGVRVYPIQKFTRIVILWSKGSEE